MEKVNHSKLGYKNLMAFYMAKTIINMWIEKENGEFAKGIYEHFKKKRTLAPKQIIGAYNWIKNIKGLPKINDKWFFYETQT
jgi:hypothetical protein